MGFFIFSGMTRGSNPSTEFHSKWLNPCGLAQQRAFCSKKITTFKSPDNQTPNTWANSASFRIWKNMVKFPPINIGDVTMGNMIFAVFDACRL